MRKLHAFFVSSVSLLAACNARIGTQPPSDACVPTDAPSGGTVATKIRVTSTDKLDLLFVVDNQPRNGSQVLTVCNSSGPAKNDGC